MSETTTTITKTNLSDLVDAFKRQVALPGGFETAYPNVTDDDLADSLADAFSECQLDGWFGTYTIRLTSNQVSPALTPAARALVVVYAGMRWVRIQMLSIKSNVRYKAGPVEYETAQAASLLTQLLKDMTARKDALIADAKYGAGASYVMDAVWGREWQSSIGRFAPLELPGRAIL